MLKENKEVVDCFFEALGGSNDEQNRQMDKDVSDFLLNDLESKLIEILQESKKLMRHSKRHILTTQDIQKTFQKMQIPDAYGYPSSTPLTMTKLQNENQNLWFYKPEVINLREFVQRPNFESAKVDIKLSKYLTAVDGHQPETAENVREVIQARNEDPQLSMPFKEVVALPLTQQKM